MSAPPRPLTVEKHGHSRFWAVRDGAGELVVVAAYKTGAEHVARLLALTKRTTTKSHGFDV